DGPAPGRIRRHDRDHHPASDRSSAAMTDATNPTVGGETARKSQVTVTVSGLTGSGKSAVYGEIVLAMQAIGVPVVHADEKAWRTECHMAHADWQDGLNLYRPVVTMVEQNISRGRKIVRHDRTQSVLSKIADFPRASI